MAEPVKVFREEEETPESYRARIRALVEKDHVSAARRLVKEACHRFPNDPKLAYWQDVLAPAKVIAMSPAREVDRSAEIRWLDTYGPSYKGEWLAVLGDRLLGHSRNLSELVSELKKNPTRISPLLQYIPDID